MHQLNLPEPIAAYYAAEQQTPEALARCFTAQAVVKDEGHAYTGPEEIKAWKAAASAKYTFTTEPLVLEQEQGAQLVRARVTGDFPGSPVVLQYRFRLQRGLIASLEITA
ncbi:polyketide cyclase [Variovorax paradoxus]|uniref:Polyketide cyclase n=1 Tax=Variovorax paradoxus TaxID=34073 RepID=A0A0D0MGB9_VARPD|nr:nuclear transport factor 2 family protein [Variovorax paradoxus]KIQ31371.1 polyketide cyclase [Variovorax paradoxus]